jgi:predicted DNA-binding protein (MmcQ/YjbR family)
MAGRRRTPSQRERVAPVPLELPGASLTFPFGDDVSVYKVGVQAASGDGGRHTGGKMFCLVSLDADPGTMTLKVDPDHGVELVREHEAISPGYHTNKRHWITVVLDGSVEDVLIRELVEDSYDLVVSTLPARVRFDVDPDRFPLPTSRTTRS